MKAETQRDIVGNLNSIVYLRALAAIMVLFFHYSSQLENVVPSTLLSLTSLGQLGVHMFFIISGFVIPLQLERRGYSHRDVGKFFLNRLLRIYPCFLVVLIGATVVWQAQYMVLGGTAPDLSALNIVYNLVLGVDVFGGNHFLNVSWTLLIEFSYYLVLALIYPLIFKANDWKFPLGSILLLGASFVGGAEQQFVNFFKWTPFFVAGFALFMALSKGRWSVNLAIILLCLGCIIARDGYHQGWVQSILCCLTLLFIRWGPNKENKVFLHLGVISFSIYLVHAPIGHKVAALNEKLLGGSPVVVYFSFILATLVTIGVATLLYYWIEKPSNQWARLVWQKRQDK